MIREKLSIKQLKRMEETEGEVLLKVDVSDPNFSVEQEFEACDSNWRIEINGTEFETIGFNLTNLSSEPMRTKYMIVVKNQSSTGDDHIWREPDGVLVFSPVGTVDEAWGCDEIISFRTLHTVTGLCVKNIAHFLVKLTIFNTTDEVNAKRKHDLRIPTDAKIKSLEGTYREEFNQQDMLISRRLTSFDRLDDSSHPADASYREGEHATADSEYY
jgi:hypothetical protein